MRLRAIIFFFQPSLRYGRQAFSFCFSLCLIYHVTAEIFLISFSPLTKTLEQIEPFALNKPFCTQTFNARGIHYCMTIFTYEN